MAAVEAKKFPLQQVLELACAAQRYNKDYIKQVGVVFADDDVKSSEIIYQHANRTLMVVALGEDHSTYPDKKAMPPLITTNLADRDLSTEIQKYYRRLIFAAIQGDSEFQTELNSLLNSQEVPLNKFGFIACLPSVYKRDYAKSQLEKRIDSLDKEWLADIGEVVLDLDCEVLSSQRSKNFDAYNIDAIINNKMVSWMGKADLNVGACVVIKAKVKDHNKHWKHDIPVTRLNYVKAFQ
jgi:hypothetical protein